MHEWWYLQEGARVGPIPGDQLLQLWHSRRLGPATLVWRAGLERWTPMSDVEELRSGMERVPPLPQQATPSVVPQVPLSPEPPPWALRPRARCWPRFFARLFDLWWEAMLVCIPVSWVFVIYLPGFLAWMSLPCLPLALMLDAVVCRVAGNTPGKALLGLRVVESDGTPLSLGHAVARNLGLWLRGLGLGIPPLLPLTMARQCRRLGRGEPAGYDAGPGCEVLAKPVGLARKAVFGVLFVAGPVGQTLSSLWFWYQYQ